MATLTAGGGPRGTPVRHAVRVALALLLGSIAVSCTYTPESQPRGYSSRSGGFYHTIRPRRESLSHWTAVRRSDGSADPRESHRGCHRTQSRTAALHSQAGRGSARARAPRGGTDPDLKRRIRSDAKRGARVDFQWPLSRTKLTSRFGRRNGQPHEGIDLGARQGTPIRAAESGKVIHAGRLGAYGKVVILKHAGDYRSVYAHARKLHVRKGQFVERAQKIAEVGMTGRTTGPHLHFEIRKRDVPKDPLHYLP